MTTALRSIEEALEAVNNAMLGAAASGKFMAAIWYFDADKLKCRKTSWEFPTASFSEALENLRGLLRREMIPNIVPLKTAKLPGDTDDSGGS